MNQITGAPLDYTFGLEFNYALWTKDTVLTLTNVPWNNDYRDIVDHKTHANLNAYINAHETTNARITGVSQANINRPVKINIPVNRASRFNYLRASNPIQPGILDTQQDYFYFITGVNYIAGNTTELIVQLDLWSTYGINVEFGNSYIERGHVGIANSKNFDNYGRDYLTKPEGLDVGGEYVTKKYRTKKVMSLNAGAAVGYDILVASVIDLEAEAGDVATGPKLVTASGGLFSGLPAGASYYVFKSVESLTAFLGNNASKPWVTQGIISITIIPSMNRYSPGFAQGAGNFVKAPTAALNTLTHSIEANWRTSVAFNPDLIPARYAALKKFYTYPYMVIEMTTWNGTPIILKPESWNDASATIIERANLVPPNQRIVFAPQHYNSALSSGVDDNGKGAGDDGGDYLDIATMISNLPTMAILNNAAIGYMASNFNSIAYQNQSADWSQQRALQGMSTSFDQASAGMDLSSQMANIGINSDRATVAQGNQNAVNQAGLSAVTAVGTGLANGGVGVAGGMASAAAGLASTGMTLGNNNAMQGIRTGSAIAANSAQNSNTGYVRDTNYLLAQYSARGDYQNTIAGINAKVQDAKMTQPTTSGQVGGEAMNIVHNNVEVSLRWKTIDKSAMVSIGEYWLRYGYAVQQFARVSQLMVMSKFTYWKLSETYIKTAPMPESYKQAIRGIFEKGVTIWANADDIGMIDIADNVPLTGVTL